MMTTRWETSTPTHCYGSKVGLSEPQSLSRNSGYLQVVMNFALQVNRGKKSSIRPTVSLTDGDYSTDKAIQNKLNSDPINGSESDPNEEKD